MPPCLHLTAAITFPSPGSGLPLICHRPITVRFVDLCELEWKAAEAAALVGAAALGAADEGEWQGEAVASVSARALDLRLKLRVPAVLGLIGSSCTVRCCGKTFCRLRVMGAARDGSEGDEGVEVQVQGRGTDGGAWMVEALAACI